MVNESSSQIFITFLLAIIGYAGLTITLLLSLPIGRQGFKRKVPILLWRIAAAIIFIHVIMVWTFRYDWQFSLAVRNGYSGFLVFQSALLMILFSAIVKESFSKILIRISFIVVSIGAVGSVFRNEVVEIYKVPVLICAILGIAALLFIFIKRFIKDI